MIIILSFSIWFVIYSMATWIVHRTKTLYVICSVFTRISRLQWIKSFIIVFDRFVEMICFDFCIDLRFLASSYCHWWVFGCHHETLFSNEWNSWSRRKSLHAGTTKFWSCLSKRNGTLCRCQSIVSNLFGKILFLHLRIESLILFFLFS